MNHLDNAISEMRRARSDLISEMNRLDKQLSRVEKTLKLWESTSNGASGHKDRPPNDEIERRRAAVEFFVTAYNGTFTVEDFLNSTGEPRILHRPYQSLFGNLVTEGKLVRVKRGLYEARK